jgi:hypothetical protein
MFDLRLARSSASQVYPIYERKENIVMFEVNTEVRSSDKIRRRYRNICEQAMCWFTGSLRPQSGPGTRALYIQVVVVDYTMTTWMYYSDRLVVELIRY